MTGLLVFGGLTRRAVDAALNVIVPPGRSSGGTANALPPVTGGQPMHVIGTGDDRAACGFVEYLRRTEAHQ